MWSLQSSKIANEAYTTTSFLRYGQHLAHEHIPIIGAVPEPFQICNPKQPFKIAFLGWKPDRESEACNPKIALTYFQVTGWIECASDSSCAVKDNAGKLTVKEVNGNIVQAD